MPNAVLLTKGAELLNGQINLRCDLSAEYTTGGVTQPLNFPDITLSYATSLSSVTQKNNAIRSAALAYIASQGFTGTGLTTSDITIHGGAQ